MKRHAILLTVAILSSCASTYQAPEAHAGYILTGTGMPIVVLQAGFGDGKETWNQIIPDLARDHTVFAYDRPGTGVTAPTDAPRDPCTIAAELRASLRAAGLKPPYLLVGHSLGGLYQYVYAKLYPVDVAGFVLVDPTHPRNWEAVQSEQPEAATLIKAMKWVAWSDVQRREFDSQAVCLDKLEMARPITLPGKVLISGRPQSLANDRYEKKRLALGLEWRQMANLAQVDMVWDSSHFIQKEQPEAVIAAIRQVSGRGGAKGQILQPAKTVTLGSLSPINLEPGKTSREQVEQVLGEPSEIMRDGTREIWIYSDKPLEIPWAVSFIPVIGDVLDVVELIQDARGQHELVLQFDEHGIIHSYTLRELKGRAAGS
jgi:pimeloyl-ACP methyl ester carboxylesterase